MVTVASASILVVEDDAPRLEALRYVLKTAEDAVRSHYTSFDPFLAKADDVRLLLSSNGSFTGALAQARAERGASAGPSRAPRRPILRGLSRDR